MYFVLNRITEPLTHWCSPYRTSQCFDPFNRCFYIYSIPCNQCIAESIFILSGNLLFKTISLDRFRHSKKTEILQSCYLLLLSFLS